jgi:hypothetical protein
MATLWLVGLFTPYRAAIMVITSLATTGIVVATELVADPRWLTGRGTFAALAIAVAVAVGVLLSALVIVFVLAAGALTLVIGAGIARRAWR